MPGSGEDDLNTEDDRQMDIDVLPTIKPQTAAQIPFKSYYPFPFYAFTPHGVPYAFTETLWDTPFQTPRLYPTTAPSPVPISADNLVGDRENTTRAYLTVREKLDKVFGLLKEVNWTMGDLLYYAFHTKDEGRHKIKKRSQTHAKMASRFLGGFCKYGPAEIVEIWVKSPWGIPKRGHWERDEIQSLGTSPDSAVRICLDNVQSYVRPHNFHIGREAHMITGTASTAIQSRSFKELCGLIDHTHIDLVCVLQWLAAYKANVQKLYNTRGQKYHAHPRKSQIYPLPTNRKNETVTSKLAQSLHMIYHHIGQTESSYTPRLILTGGDGLTYERMVQLKNYLQSHETAYKRLDILEPLLEIWHTEWTDLSRIYEAHWDSLTSQDPSSLGHSANKIKCKAPSNLKKLAYQVLDAHMLDCWRIILCGKNGDLLKHLELMATAESLPTIEILMEKATMLQEMYGIPGAFDRALRGTYVVPNTQIPEGSSWEQPATEESSVGIETRQKKKNSRKNKGKEAEGNNMFTGDATLGQSCRFIYNTMIS
ncbi:hypothetical protein L208DRAFT_1374943 [Tricholoma matsutake]|nr:hypothetical protein L208DRAFT_1374943 [Tricholoma matsutake 945]